MAIVPNPVRNGLYKKIGKGDIFIATYPTADPGTGTLSSTISGYYGLFYTDPAARKALKAGVKPLCETTNGGLTLKIKSGAVEFQPNNGPKESVDTGIESVEGEFAFYDMDAAHLAWLFGADASQLIADAAAAGKAGRKTVAISGGSSSARYCLMFRMPSTLTPGEYDHVIVPHVRLKPELDLKLSSKDAAEAKVSLVVMPDAFAYGADGTGVLYIADNADAAAL